MKIALVQANLHWEDSEKNLLYFSHLIENISDVDIIVLPEMFTTGFTMNSEQLSQSMEGKAVLWMKEAAQKKNAVIVASIIIKDANNYFNRLFWVEPEGNLHTYDKRHLFRMANEHEYFTAGKNRVIVEYKGVRFCLQVCYDLRFPVWSRNVDEQGNSPAFDCLLYVANWPEARSDAWTSLLKARAIENQVFVIGVNRVGVDGKGINYSGDSRFYSPKGKRLDTIRPNEEMIDSVNLNLKELLEFREKFPVGKDADGFSIIYK